MSSPQIRYNQEKLYFVGLGSCPVVGRSAGWRAAVEGGATVCLEGKLKKLSFASHRVLRSQGVRAFSAKFTNPFWKRQPMSFP